jgi:hypothetical protein
MRQILLLLAALALPGVGLADGFRESRSRFGTLPAAPPEDCGGDAYSFAEVVEGGPPRRGPVTSRPDTLCADVVDARRGEVGPISIYPNVTPPGRDGDPEPEPGRRRPGLSGFR